MSMFARSVLDAVDRIPPGRVMSYADVAEAADRPGAARGVGGVLARYGGEVPWHRVLRADGTCATGKADRQLALLIAEGVPVADGRVDMARARWV
jgi:alkylated DNA nucleotide flippase Atl1